jgi:thioredoxin 1
MIERLLFLLLFLGLCVAGYYAVRAWQAARLRRLARVEAPSPVAEVVREAGPALLYFTTDDCAQCRFQQRPILERLAHLAPIPVVTVDAIQREDLARHFGILTVPTTVVLDGNRRPVAINHGVAPLHKLQAQVAAVVV